VLGLLSSTSGALVSTAAAHVPDNSPGAFATSTCSFDGSGFYWMRLLAPSLFYSPAASLSADDLSGAAGGWPASSQPSACAVAAGGLYALVSAAPTSSTVTIYAAAPALPTSAAGLAWAAVVSLATPGGAAAGFAFSPSGLEVFVAASAGGVFRAARASLAAPFSAFVANAATAGVPASDVLVNANGLTVYVLTPYYLAAVDARGDWAAAPLVNVTAAADDGTTFLGVALAPRA
jgi:hypothetical protein